MVLLSLGRHSASGVTSMSSFAPHEPETVAQFLVRLLTYGHCVVTDNRHQRPVNHHIIGVGAGHDDAVWCESRGRTGSHAAWAENDPQAVTFGGGGVETIVRRATHGDR